MTETITDERFAKLKVVRDLVEQNVVIGPEGTRSVHFFRVGIKPGSTLTGKELRDAILDAPKGDFQDLTEKDWRGGPSYITIGAWIGDQGIALTLIGLGAELGIISAVTPETLHITDKDMADDLAGRGYIMGVLL
jgi:hypothetical protein